MAGHFLRCSCPQGHRIKVVSRLAGRRVRCPKCRSAVQIPEIDVTESGVASLLTLWNDQSAANHKIPEPTLTAKESTSVRVTVEKQRQCGKCRQLIAESASVCVHCQTMQFPSSTRLKELFRSASQFVHRR
jgi:tRNA G26 N,N-dimethylase Trm1